MKRASSSRKSATDIGHVAGLKDSDIAADRDNPPWTPEMFARAVVKRGISPTPPKRLLSLRIDSDVVEWFRSQGRGYQSQMNALLRAYMVAHQSRNKRTRRP